MNVKKVLISSSLVSLLTVVGIFIADPFCFDLTRFKEILSVETSMPRNRR